MSAASPYVRGEPLPKSWHKQQDTTVSPEDQPGAKGPFRIRLVWDDYPGQTKECWLPWPFDDAKAAHDFIQDCKKKETKEVDDDPGPVPSPAT
jgi:hypothetical protein